MSEQTHRIAESICRDFAWNGHTFREGQYVAVLGDRVIAVADNPNDAIQALRSLDPDPKRGMVVEVAHPVVEVIR